jgi:hypothetical protein
MGRDVLTGRNYDHRKQWIYDRVQELVRIFAIDACVYAILSNHYHLIVRNRVDLATQWSDEEVVRRWWQLYPERRDDNGEPAEPTELEIHSLLANHEDVAEWRKRLSSISWFMKSLNEWIAVRANAEDGTKGHFWADRFGCRNLLDECAILACSIYIDLNELRAKLAETPEGSTNSSAYRRILARIKRREREAAGEALGGGDYQEGDPDFGLCPLNEQDHAPLLGPPGVASVLASKACDPTGENSATVRKQWRHGFLSCTVDEYLEFLDWNARCLAPGKAGVMDAELPPILARLGIEPSSWVTMIEHFDQWFHRAIGRPARMMEEAARVGRQWLQGIGHLRSVLG